MTFESIIDPRAAVARLGGSQESEERPEWKAEVRALAYSLRGPSLEAANSWSSRTLKRVIDILLGSALAAAALPVIGVLALCVAVSFRTWPFFVQRRVGRHGRLFTFPKLRTLDRSTPPYASKYEIPTDIGRFASFLRRTHLDELPQLLVVPLGWMSLVGPRPKMPHEFEPAPQWYVEARTVVAQGCTGLWQVGNHTHEMPHETPEYDLFYLHNACLRLDLWILWRTLLKVAGVARSVELEDIPRWATRARSLPRDMAVDSTTP